VKGRRRNTHLTRAAAGDFVQPTQGRRAAPFNDSDARAQSLDRDLGQCFDASLLSRGWRISFAIVLRPSFQSQRMIQRPAQRW
jgi:hypothetical protein